MLYFVNAFADFVMTFSSMVCVCCPCLLASSNLVTSWRTKFTLSNFYSFVILVVLLMTQASREAISYNFVSKLNNFVLSISFIFEYFKYQRIFSTIRLSICGESMCFHSK